jgi:hypothetical protein
MIIGSVQIQNYRVFTAKGYLSFRKGFVHIKTVDTGAAFLNRWARIEDNYTI